MLSTKPVILNLHMMICRQADLIAMKRKDYKSLVQILDDEDALLEAYLLAEGSVFYGTDCPTVDPLQQICRL